MKVSELSGPLLDLWVARNDPRCEGIHWQREGDDWIGYGTIGTSPEFPCLVIPASINARERTRLATKHRAEVYAPHEDWAQAGPIIQREKIEWSYMPAGDDYPANFVVEYIDGERVKPMYGPTELIAAMRAYVASKYGDEVPDEVATPHHPVLSSSDAGSFNLSITPPVSCEGEINFDRLAGDGEFQHLHEGDFVWIKGTYGTITIPKTRCEVIASDSLSITVRVPPFAPT